MNSRTTTATRPISRWAAFVALLAGLLLLTAIASLLLGARAIPLGDLWTVLTQGPGVGSDEGTVVWGLRFPRTVLAAAAGASLAVAGAFAQSWTRNPLADPGIIGLTAGASFFVAIFFTLGLSSSAWTAVAAIIGAAITAAVVVAATRKAKDSLTLILVGVGLSWALTSAATLLALQSDRIFDGMRQWNVGSTVGKDGGDITIAVAGLVIGLILASLTCRPMDILALGDDAASGLGSSPNTTRALAGFVVVTFAGMATAAVGPIVFVGFAAPHLVRPFTGPTLSRMYIPVAFAGAILTVVADIIGRLVMRPGELEVSIVLAIVGAPFLIAAVVKGIAK